MMRMSVLTLKDAALILARSGLSAKAIAIQLDCHVSIAYEAIRRVRDEQALQAMRVPTG